MIKNVIFEMIAFTSILFSTVLVFAIIINELPRLGEEDLTNELDK